ncbi:YafY family protein [Phenylobacterium sp. CCH12-B4]|uniref:helix-turn-helix transcriptional regulator n=1 Tax=Phenylobacterium sp. CCH12-B4 TaxID=1768784 RepID=UPI00083AE27A|nr:WYL domain-containing protein [Phenylobacterium sp. CCH12-B4]
MRHEKGAKLLELARLLASSAEGLTLDEMAERLDVGRRTAERMRDAVWEMFPQMEAVDDPAAEMMDRQGAAGRAAALRSLEQKVLSATRASARRRLAPDLEALLQAETIAVTAGPRPFEEESVLAAVREGLKSLSTLRFRYEGGSTPGRLREVVPYGILFGRSNYLVAEEVGAGTGPRNWRLDRIVDVEVTGAPGAPPEHFSLQAYADESFGIYQDDTHDVLLRILPEGREDAVRWRFHARQKVEAQADGGTLVRFRASGMRELAWHLFTWGDKVEILEPDALKEMMAGELTAALRVHVRN